MSELFQYQRSRVYCTRKTEFSLEAQNAGTRDCIEKKKSNGMSRPDHDEVEKSLRGLI